MDKLADFIKKATGKDWPRYAYSSVTDEIFLYHRLEKGLWTILKSKGITAEQGEAQILSEVANALESQPKLGWMPARQAIIEHEFLPAGFEKACVHDELQRCLGDVAITCGGHLAYPIVATTDDEWVSIIKYLMCCSAKHPEPSNTEKNTTAYILVPGAHPKIRWVAIQDGRLQPGPGIVRYRKPSEMVEGNGNQLPHWAYEDLLELEPTIKWDEGEPELLTVLSASDTPLTKPYTGHLTKLLVAYERCASPEELCRLWLELSKSVAYDEPEIDLDTLVESTLRLPTLPGLGSQVDDVFSASEIRGVQGLTSEYEAAISEGPRDKIALRERQMAEARARYPQLNRFSTEALTFWWREYIHKTENRSADVAEDPRFMVSERPFDVDFVYFMVISSTDSLGGLRYVFLNQHDDLVSAMLAYLGLEQDAKMRVKGSILLLADILNSMDLVDASELLHEWRHHAARLMSVAVGSAIIASICLPYCSKGPELFSHHDAIYCENSGIIMSHRVPRQ